MTFETIVQAGSLVTSIATIVYVALTNRIARASVASADSARVALLQASLPSVDVRCTLLDSDPGGDHPDVPILELVVKSTEPGPVVVSSVATDRVCWIENEPWYIEPTGGRQRSIRAYLLQPPAGAVTLVIRTATALVEAVATVQVGLTTIGTPLGTGETGDAVVVPLVFRSPVDRSATEDPIVDPCEVRLPGRWALVRRAPD